MKQEVIKKLIESVREYGLPEVLDYVFGKNIKVDIDFSREACESSIDELFFSVRSQNALKRANILTVGELVDALNNGNLRNLRNVGAKSFREIQTRILVYGYENLSEKSRWKFFDKLIDLNTCEGEINV